MDCFRYKLYKEERVKKEKKRAEEERQAAALWRFDSISINPNSASSGKSWRGERRLKENKLFSVFGELSCVSLRYSELMSNEAYLQVTRWSCDLDHLRSSLLSSLTSTSSNQLILNLP